MDKKKIWIIIIGSGIVASLTTACGFFPDYKLIFTAGTGLISAIIAFVSGMGSSKE